MSDLATFAGLLSQCLHLGELRRILKDQVTKASAPVAHRPTRTANNCMFWERGRCDRGANCKFYHDPGIPQSDARKIEAAHRDMELELNIQLAHAAAILGRRNACRHALRKAAELQQVLLLRPR